MGEMNQKLPYELEGNGSLFTGTERLFEIAYQLKFFQEGVVAEGEETITGLTDFSGQAVPGDQFQLAVLVGNQLTLHLEHDRCLDVIIQSSCGNLIKCGEIYKCGELKA